MHFIPYQITIFFNSWYISWQPSCHLNIIHFFKILIGLVLTTPFPTLPPPSTQPHTTLPPVQPQTTSSAITGTTATATITTTNNNNGRPASDVSTSRPCMEIVKAGNVKPLWSGIILQDILFFSLSWNQRCALQFIALTICWKRRTISRPLNG